MTDSKTSSTQTRSSELMERSRRIFPGGVNSPVRSFASVGGSPIVFSHGEGKWLTSVDGNRYVDFCGSWGPLIVGYSHPDVVEAVTRQAKRALTFGAPSEEELLLAEKIQEWVPGLEMMRFVSSGTEATMSALRAARAATGRDKIVKFEGCYHGHADFLLVKAGSGLATLSDSSDAKNATAPRSAPSSAGVPAGAVADTLTLPFNDVAALEALFAAQGKEIAAVIVEPMAANMGLVLPRSGFLETLRALTRAHGSVLIFDEVMTGFRVARGGAAEAFGVTPDLWTFGKIVGGGLPAAAYGGTKDVMRHVAPLGKAYQAGTLSGNPLAMAAGLATLGVMERTGAFEKLEATGRELDSLVRARLGKALSAGHVSYVRKASFFCFFFGTSALPANFQQVSGCDMPLFGKVYHAWLNDGLYMGPSGYEVGFLSTCHERADCEQLVNTVARVLGQSL
ncbi:MAG: glutamate-1-semialdehyde 2,1-aminomutase [Silvanigrellales bacterium]|nr:glutamate-1-semialdehyde 2,1-aminomutase [Silvanigrellales bacterium]